MLEVIIVALYALLMAALGIVIIGIRYSENEKKDFNINSVFKHRDRFKFCVNVKN
jgi:hypothetical protein